MCENVKVVSEPTENDHQTLQLPSALQHIPASIFRFLIFEIRAYPAYCKHSMVFTCAKLNTEHLNTQKVSKCVCANTQWQSYAWIFRAI